MQEQSTLGKLGLEPLSIAPMIRLRALAVCLLAAVPVLATAAAGRAAPPPTDLRVIGNYGDWEALTYTESGSKVCFIGTKPKDAKGDYTSRGDIFLLVTHRPAESRNGVVIIETGYPYKPESTVEVKIDGKSFRMWTDGEYAYAYANEDKVLVQAMKRGMDMVVQGRSARGTLTTDTYSLSGFTDAYETISKACGVSG